MMAFLILLLKSTHFFISVAFNVWSITKWFVILLFLKFNHTFKKKKKKRYIYYLVLSYLPVLLNWTSITQAGLWKSPTWTWRCMPLINTHLNIICEISQCGGIHGLSFAFEEPVYTTSEKLYTHMVNMSCPTVLDQTPHGQITLFNVHNIHLSTW